MLMLLLSTALSGAVWSQPYSVAIRTTVIPPVSPFFDQMLSSVTGGRLIVIVSGGSPTGAPLAIRLSGTLQRLAPSPFTVSLSTGFQPSQPINLTPGLPVTLTNDLLEQAFGNFTPNNLSFQDISVNDLRDGLNYKLPEGTYRICFTAFAYNDAGYARPLSDPNAGCSIFSVCYKASAPQFVQPVNGVDINTGIATVNPAYPLIFSWTTPHYTCAAALPVISYNLEIHRVFPGQTPTDAMNNPPVFLKQGLPTALFPFDTILYRNVLQTGLTYAVRVRASTPPAALNTAIAFDNNGYSAPVAFQYGTPGADGLIMNQPIPPSLSNQPGPPAASTQPNPPNQATLNNKPDSANKSDSSQNNKPDSTKSPVNQNPTAFDSVADCGLTAPADSTPIDANTTLQNVAITIGDFTLTPTTITRNNDSTYKGSGTIDWKPKGVTIKLAVVFSNIRVNKEKKVYAGLVTSSTAQQQFQGFGSWASFSKASGSQLDQLSSGVDNFLSNNKASQLISQITGNTPVNFPIGIDNQNMGGTPVTLAIMSMTFSPKGATMSVLCDVNIPEANGWLSLAGTGFCIQPSGMKFSQGTLLLPTDRYFTFGSEADSIVFQGSPNADSTMGTYVSWAGDSLSAVVAHARISFPKSAIVREDTTGKALDSAVVATLGFQFHKWDDWVASITLPRFQIVGVKGLSFMPDSIFYDHSGKSNPPGFNLPKNYTGFSGTDFEGLYVSDMKVLLPPDFKTFNQGTKRTAFEAKNLVIDSKGVSADILGTNLIDITDGNLGGWAFSLDSVEVEVTQNTFAKGAFNGKIQMPISKTPLAYLGDMHIGTGDSTSKDSSLQYQFVVKPSDSMKIDLWAAYVQLNPNSAFQVKKDSLGAAISFILNGSIGIDISNGAPNLNFPALKFDSMGLANRDPKTKASKFWFSPGTWAFASPQKTVGGFPVSINNVAPYTDFSDMTDLKLGVQFDLNLNLGFGDESVVSATTKLAVYGKINASFTNQAPQITLGGGVDVDSIALKGDVGPVSVDGYLVFYNHDNTYGDGVKGHVAATFPMVAVEATAQFGSVNNFNYWYIDACATLPSPFPVVPPVGINGFGGGAYYNMQMSPNLPADPTNLTAASKANDATPGHTMSGVTFTPQQGSAGIRATVCVALLTGPQAMNAKVTLTAQITNGALSMLDLSGNVYVLTDYPGNAHPTIQGSVDINYDFTQNKFNLNADIQGTFATVQAEIPIGIYAGPDGWFFKIGDAFGKRVSISLFKDSNSVYAINVGATAYFEMGSLINPALPPLPDALVSFGVQRNPGVDALVNAMNKADGSGFMFGAQVTGSLRFSVAMLYANISAILGFDLALKHFTNSFQCNQQAAGWENWYALGQLYFYFDLDVGVHVDCWFVKGDFSLVKFEAGGVLSAGLPNPTWLDGSVHVEGQLFGGLISINTDAAFTIGDKCYPSPNPLGDVQIISDWGPRDSASVFAYPYVASNVGLNQNYDVEVPPTNQNPNGETRTFQFSLLNYTLTANNVNASGVHVQYQNNNTTGVLTHDATLLPNTIYTATVVCNAMQWYPDENRWDNPYSDQDGQREAVQQTTTWTFRTGPAPDYIPDFMVHLAYPVKNERYVLKNEFGGAGILQLDQIQPNILPVPGGGNNAGSLAGHQNYAVYFIAIPGGDTLKTTFTVDMGTKTIHFNLPAGLKSNTVYREEFWSTPGVPATFSAKALTNVSASTRTVGGVSVNIRQTRVTNAVGGSAAMPKPIYTTCFSTSQYNNFADKLSAMGTWAGTRNGDNVLIGTATVPAELFDQFDINGFTAPDGTSWPALFNARIEWSHGQTNDGFMDNNVYAPVWTLAPKHVSVNFGAALIREQIFEPVQTLDWSGFSVSSPLSLSETGTAVSRYASLSPALARGVSLGGASSSGLTTVTTSAGYSVSIPSSLGVRPVTASRMPGIKMVLPPTMTWSRDHFLREDCNLMSSFGLLAQTQISIIQHQLDPNDAANILGQMDGDISFCTNAVGGSVTMPWNQLYNLYTDPAATTLLGKLRQLSFTPYPAGPRTINFRYQAGPLQSVIVTKSFTTK
ncbi:MAG TPA: hypothetical protein VN616_10255 [Puia sp.]|nr:hypothetical protein [Puia sp.]